jgi:hypothetical protein
LISGPELLYEAPPVVKLRHRDDIVFLKRLDNPTAQSLAARRQRPAMA